MVCVRALVALAVLLPLAAPRRVDMDFEFDDDADAMGGATAVTRRPRRYIYDPHNSLCASLVCARREVCLLRDAFTALCANKKDILRKGDVIVATSAAGSRVSDGEPWADDDEDGLYDTAPDTPDTPDTPDAPDAPDTPERCVSCGPGGAGAGVGGFVCGGDNRTYSSLCRLDLHNCLRRARVRPRCAGFCPCARTHGRAPPHARAQAVRRVHNDVLPPRRRDRTGSEGCAMDKMANRLLDWFSVLMEDAGATVAPDDGFPSDCKPEVRWMFAHLDTDGDGLLSLTNLYALRHDERERCLRPFLSRCARPGSVTGAAGSVTAGSAPPGWLTRGAWCACVRRASRPCAALAAARAPGGYSPACDAQGYYRPRQCHAALGVCWCVDAHGAEVPGSRGRGAPPCGPRARTPRPPPRATPRPPPRPTPRPPADDEDAPASGDGELRF